MTTMTKTELHPQPAWSVVAMEQLRAVGLAMRREAALVFGLLLGFLLVIAVDGRLGPLPFSPEVAIPAILVAAMAPWAVWKLETPERRSFFWSLPVPRGPHQLVKVAAGWFWVMGAVGFYMLLMLVVALATGGEIGVWHLRLPIDPSTFQLGGDEWTDQVFRTPAWQWLVPFTAATTTYLFGSAVMVGSNHPIRLLGGIVIFFVALAMMSDSPDSPLHPYFWQFAGDAGPLGLENLIDPQEPAGAFEIGRTAQGKPITFLYGFRPSAQRWLSATSLWLGLALAGTLFVSLRHRDP